MAARKEPLAWMNGRFIPQSNACLPITDMGLVHGASVTEMTRSFDQRWFRLDDHLKRLETSLKTIGWRIPYSFPELSVVADRLLEENVKHIPPGHELGVIQFVTAGQNLTYLGAARAEECRRPTVCCHTFPLPCELWAAKYEAGQSLLIPPIRQLPPDCLSPLVKHRSRLHWVLADASVRERDPQANAILLDQDGDLTETSGGNFFLVKDRVLLTPRPKFVLSGISRYFVLLLAEELGLQIQVTEIHPAAVRTASEAFTSSTPYCLLPVTKFDGKPVGDGKPGPVYRQLLKAWGDRLNYDIPARMHQIAQERLASTQGAEGAESTPPAR